MFPADSSLLPSAIVFGLFGTVACVATELVIARFLPRLGHLPGIGARTSTAVLTGVLCAGLALRLGVDWALPAFVALAVLSVQLGRIDLQCKLLPNPLVLALLLAGLTLFTLSSFALAQWTPLLRAGAGACILFIAYLLLALITPSGIGMGDVKLAAPLGLYLGYLGWAELFYGGTCAFVIGGIVSAVLLRLRRLEPSAEIAFGPSMLVATLGAIFVPW